jgi:hypothetical protein
MVGTATSYGLDDRGVGVRGLIWSRILTSPYRPGLLWGPLNLPTGGSFPGGKVAGGKADHSPPNSADLHIQSPIRLHDIMLN